MYGFSSTLSITVFWYMLSEEPGVRSMPFAVLPRKKDIFGRGVASPARRSRAARGCELERPAAPWPWVRGKRRAPTCTAEGALSKPSASYLPIAEEQAALRGTMVFAAVRCARLHRAGEFAVGGAHP